jgi:hypothetical protein
MRQHKQQCSRIQNQLTKISSLSIQQQWTNSERIQENNSIYNSLKKNQIPKNSFNKGCKWPLQGELQNTEERDRGRQQRIERSPMLMAWQNLHSKKSYTTKSNLHV